MKKEDFTGLVVYLLMIAIAVVFGFTVLKEYAPGSGLGNMFFLFVIGAIVSGIVVSALAFELGHIVGAHVGGYKTDSVNILGFCFYKSEGNRKFKLAAFDGLTGETKLAFNDKREKEPNPTPFLLFGSLFTFVMLVISIVLFVVLNNAAAGQKDSDLARAGYFILVVGVIGAMILVYNIFPAQLDTVNDGYRLTLVANPANREAFNELLRVQKAIENGDKNVELKMFDSITNFTADLNLNKVYQLLDEEKYDEAAPYIQHILDAKNNISSLIYLRTKALFIYCYIMSHSLEESKEYYDKEISLQERKEFANDVSMPSIRAYMLMSGLLDRSESETRLAITKVVKAYKRATKARQPIELRLYNKVLDKVIEAHPKWSLEGYHLEEK